MKRAPLNVALPKVRTHLGPFAQRGRAKLAFALALRQSPPRILVVLAPASLVVVVVLTLILVVVSAVATSPPLLGHCQRNNNVAAVP